MLFSVIQILCISLYATVDAFPSEHLQHIPVPGYDAKLQFLGQHVDLPEVPTKVIRITKTVAIKVPVPYPVKIPHNVPYPVHVNKPYPVPVPQIIKVPQPIPVPVPSPNHHETSPEGHTSDLSNQNHYDYGGYNDQHDHSSGGYGGSENQHYGESQQVASPLIYHQQHHSGTGPTSYQSQQISSYHGGSPMSYSVDVDHSAYPNQNVGQDSYQLKAGSSQYKNVASPPAYRQPTRVYQIEAPGQSTQIYGYKNHGQ